ncbi:hypothetical protein HELRODRAFT_62290 [Helobdella robusta]|uniref:non-specific serine/threonine protein kinase n=1 Tax=Helobdella robusta TaxID=6412 RepID=T1FWY9_HELRO|nr:hypothetical protein HELRODRAFT_62290 [Helobdella robusta]ESO12539.1 hypothetical protein HELRODRAFT_62290 [Helobdella robusta]
MESVRKLFPQTAITSLLRSMKHGNRQAQLYFPKLLQVLREHYDESLVETFKSECTTVPCWMFLDWIPQMTAILDRKESACIHSVVMSIATEYPQALVYPMRVSSVGWDFKTHSIAGKTFCDKINFHLSKNPLIEKIILESELLYSPHLFFREWWEKACNALSKEVVDKNSMLSLLKMFNSRFLLTTGGDDLPGRHGDEQMDVDGEDDEDDDDYHDPSNDLITMTSQPEKFSKDGKSLILMMKSTKMPLDLKSYSPWLANFKADLYDFSVELPGQYSGKCKPQLEQHALISSFHEVIKVLPSLRLPKRLTVRSTDDKKHHFLVKHGEDLRQDDRIESIFHLMNECMSTEYGAKNNMEGTDFLKTYKVIPMSTKLGWIEWMNDTNTLKNFITSSMTQDELNAYRSELLGPAAIYKKFIGKDYFDSYKNIERKKCIENLRSIENKVPHNIIGRAYRKLSSSLESYFFLRRNFVRSHAQLSICHYILGIGDRHLSNFMVNMLDGSLVGIDFGYAFGIATQFLAVPELVPFRLTNQMKVFMEPFQENGSFRAVMVKTLRCLRNNSRLLLSTMGVFILEPSLDWKYYAMRQSEKMGNNTDENKLCVTWYPKEKIASARRKLNGDNCSYIIKQDFQAGHKNNKNFGEAEKILLGISSDLHEVRFTMKESDLTFEEQAECLLNLATDPNVLGRAWVGWEPWM